MEVRQCGSLFVPVWKAGISSTFSPPFFPATALFPPPSLHNSNFSLKMPPPPASYGGEPSIWKKSMSYSSGLRLYSNLPLLCFIVQ